MSWVMSDPSFISMRVGKEVLSLAERVESFLKDGTFVFDMVYRGKQYFL